MVVIFVNLLKYTAVQSQNAVTTYLVKIEFRVEMGFVTSPTSCDKNSWFNCIPFQRNHYLKFAVTTKSKLVPRQTAVSEVTAFCLCLPDFDSVASTKANRSK